MKVPFLKPRYKEVKESHTSPSVIWNRGSDRVLMCMFVLQPLGYRAISSLRCSAC